MPKLFSESSKPSKITIFHLIRIILKENKLCSSWCTIMPCHPPLSAHPAGSGSSGTAQRCLPAPLGWAPRAGLPHQRETLSCVFNFSRLTKRRRWHWMWEVWPSCTRGGMALPAYKMTEVHHFLDDRISQACVCWNHGLDIYCNGLHPPMQTALISFLPRSCECLKRQEGRTSLAEKSRDNGG